jgi:hypothetical protein
MVLPALKSDLEALKHISHEALTLTPSFLPGIWPCSLCQHLRPIKLSSIFRWMCLVSVSLCYRSYLKKERNPRGTMSLLLPIPYM